jgi:hypothetical protein
VDKEGYAYFSIQDPREQLIWSKVLAQMKKESIDCQNALSQRNAILLETWANESDAGNAGNRARGFGVPVARDATSRR